MENLYKNNVNNFLENHLLSIISKNRELILNIRNNILRN